MKILAIETSCDETSASVVESGTKLLSLVTATSQDMHQKYGGIIPDRAAREQLKSIIPVVQEAVLSLFPNASSLIPDIDAIAVTYGPGLVGSLLIGVETAKSLAKVWDKPLIPINHLIGHIYANWIKTDSPKAENWTVPQFPALVLLVSGGHSELILMKDHGSFELIGSTKDDAAGECFDKCGRLLGLPYPYGPFIEKEAEKFLQSTNNIKPATLFPRPMIHEKNFDFSFSGLKTAFLRAYEQKVVSNQQLAYELQEALTDVLITKTINAAQKFNPKSILLAGGVAANHRLREKLIRATINQQLVTNVCIPPLKLCTDNAAIIASAAFFNNFPMEINKLNADPSLNITSPKLS